MENTTWMKMVSFFFAVALGIWVVAGLIFTMY